MDLASSTGLPVLVLETENAAPVVSKEDWVPGAYTLYAEGASQVQFQGELSIKGRGNSTWKYDKKPYTIKLGKGAPLLGMNKHKRWVLLANYMDRSLLRNRIAFELGKRTSLAWTPDSRYVEVILNGRFLGCYLLCEQVKVDENRVHIDEKEGFLLEVDKYFDEPNQFLSSALSLPVMIKEPDENDLAPAQFEAIQTYFNKVEQMLIDGKYAEVYDSYLDLTSFVDWWLLLEITGNAEAARMNNIYMYKDKGGKLTIGPIWDFDINTFYPNVLYTLTKTIWYPYLLKDPIFKQKPIERWTVLKEAFSTIYSFIDQEAALIKKSEKLDNRTWRKPIFLICNGDEYLSFAQSVDWLKRNILMRIEWMNMQAERRFER